VGKVKVVAPTQTEQADLVGAAVSPITTVTAVVAVATRAAALVDFQVAVAVAGVALSLTLALIVLPPMPGQDLSQQPEYKNG
jgi:hypothetical protein